MIPGNTEQTNPGSLDLGSMLVILAVSGISMLCVETARIAKAESASNIETAAIQAYDRGGGDQITASFSRDLERETSRRSATSTRKPESVATLVRNELLKQQYANRQASDTDTTYQLENST